ncbi:hypothetical protein BDW62DRAFT_134813 [Aspergillus aurantiobrunneus]
MPPPPPLHHLPNTNTIRPRDSNSNTNTNPTHITADAISIPSTYGRTSHPPNPGVIVGATLGAVFGFLLLLYLLYLSLTSGRRFSASTIGATSTTPSEIVDVGFRNRPRGPGPRRGQYADEVIVEEDLTSRSGSRSRSRRGGGGGVVEVIEEESVVDPPPSSRFRSRSRSRSSSFSRSRSRSYRRRGVREVDPMAYGGESEFSGRS